MYRKLRASVAALLCICLIFGMTATAFAQKAPTDTYGLDPLIENALAQKEEITDSANLGISKTFPTFPDIKKVVGDHSGDYVSRFVSAIYQFLEAVLKYIVAMISGFIPDSNNWVDLADYQSENFYKGHTEFLDEPTATSVWRLGYSQKSLIPDNFGTKPYRMGGYDIGKVTYSTYDDIKVRTICIDDGSGRGVTAFSVIDTVGLANTDVRQIRALLKDFAEENNIVSINVGVTHTHSGFDTQGIWAAQPETIVNAVSKNLLGLKTETSVDKELLEVLYTRTAASIREAFCNMEEGELYFAKKNAKDYFSDKSDPDIFIEDIYRFRFVPFGGGKETIIANFGAHPETVGLKTADNPGDVLSADFVYYTEEVINEAGYNFMYFQGAIGSLISTDRGLTGDGLSLNRYQQAVRYGEEIGYFILGMTLTEEECRTQVADADREAAGMAESDSYTLWYEGWTPVTETKVEPVFNVAFRELTYILDNPLTISVGKLGMANNIMLLDDKNNICTVTEVGFIEFGKDIKVVVMPGETAPELFLGGSTMTAEGSSRGKDFVYPPLFEVFDDCELLTFNVMNDSAGYIVPDNDYGLATLRYNNGVLTYNADGMLSFGSSAASTLITEFLYLVREYR